MRDADRRVRGVDALAARPGRAIDVDAQVLFLHLHVHVFRFRQDRHRDGRRVDAAGRLGGGHALDAMDAPLELEPAPRALALDEQNHFLVAADAGDAGVHHLDLPALALGVLRVHAQEVGREQPGLVAAGPGTNLDEDILVIAGIAREQEPLEVAFE